MGVRIERIKKNVMSVLTSKGITGSLKSFGIENVIPPNLLQAKQTETAQRFKIHLLMKTGEDLFPKIDFSRRGLIGLLTLLFLALSNRVFSEPAPAANFTDWAQGGATIPETRIVIPMVDRPTLLEWIRSDQPVVFLDIREPHEFDGEHLPHAVNITYREIKEKSELIPRQAVIIPYCKKDFRAYVASRRLVDLGYTHVFLMKPRGLEGWKEDALPTSGAGTDMTEAQAWEILNQTPPGKFPKDEVRSLPKQIEGTGEVRTVHLKAKHLFFDPETIEVTLGDRLVINLYQEGEGHGLVIPAFDIYLEALPEGEAASIEFIASKQGVFYFACPICCTQRAQCKQGRLIVRAPQVSA